MGAFDNAAFANEIGHLYQYAAQTIGDYLTNNITALSSVEITKISDDQARIISYANSFYTLSDNIAFGGSDAYFKKVQDATAKIKDDIKKIATVNDIVAIAAGVITLAAAILSGDGQGIATAVIALVGTAAGAVADPKIVSLE